MPLHGLTSRCVLFALILFLTRVPGVYAEQHARALETDRPFLEQQSPTAPAACDCDTLSSHSSGVSTDTDERTWQLDALPRLRSALQVMQTTWFDIRLGTWPSGIDWTNAVIDTHLISVVGTLSKALLRLRLDGNGTGTGSIAASERELEDEIEWYFDHTVSSHLYRYTFSFLVGSSHLCICDQHRPHPHHYNTRLNTIICLPYKVSISLGSSFAHSARILIT